MNVITSVSEMQRDALAARAAAKRIGLVPTMGFLHAGHLALVELAKQRCDFVILTLFVNPAQFAPEEDLARYPRDFDRDRALAESAGVAALFAPAAEEMYPTGFETYITAERRAAVLEGAFRPAHFRGVLTVVAKLFNITQPHLAVFGQKDAQQAVLIKRMARDLNFPVEIAVAPIVREPDGLAMSSRNVYLSAAERAQALSLSRALRNAEASIAAGARTAVTVVNAVTGVIAREPDARIDYVAVVDAESLDPLDELRSGTAALIALAVRIGKTRLIDNAIVRVP